MQMCAQVYHSGKLFSREPCKESKHRHDMTAHKDGDKEDPESACKKKSIAISHVS